MDFDAGALVMGEQLDELLNVGVTPNPTQWIDTDKNMHLMGEGKKHEPLFKSRLVGMGT